MVSRALTAAASAGAFLLPVIALAGLPAPAAGVSGTSFTWVGSAPNQGDGRSWTDPRNWDPQGVPGDGDFVFTKATRKGTCTVDINRMPAAVQVKQFSLSSTAGCHAELHGGQITVTSALTWSGGTLDTALVIAPTAAEVVIYNHGPAHSEMDQDLTVQGILGVRTTADNPLRFGGHADLHVASGGVLLVDPGAEIQALDPNSHNELDLDHDGQLFVDQDPTHSFGAATISGFSFLDRGITAVGAGSTLRIAVGQRGLIANAQIRGGGRLLLGDPTTSRGTTSLSDRSRLVLLPGGTIDGRSQFEGDGFMTWRGGHLSGYELEFGLLGFTVAGTHPKVIDRENDQHGSNVLVDGPTTFAAGTDERHNVLDTKGNSFVEQFATLTLRDDVELRGGFVGETDGEVVIDPGPGGTVFADRDSLIQSANNFDLRSGTLLSRGQVRVGLLDGMAHVAEGAVLRLPDQGRFTLSGGGTLTGQGEIAGTVRNEDGTFEPFTAGSDSPLRIDGPYAQQPGARLLLDLTATTQPLHLGGSATVQGTVTYHNEPGYDPQFDDMRTIFTTDGPLTWSPGCEETTGSGADAGHWVSAQQSQLVTATFVTQAGGVC